jgi:tetratricopeptide (TPR) repeat protein
MRKNSKMSVGLELAERESVAWSLAEALKLHQAGRLADAEQIYRRVLATRPDNFDSLHLLGVIFYQRGRYAEAVRQIDAALQRNPNNAAALNNRGNALMGIRQFEEALASYERAGPYSRGSGRWCSTQRLNSHLAPWQT